MTTFHSQHILFTVMLTYTYDIIFIKYESDFMLDENIKDQIKMILRKMMDGVMQKRLVDEPWNLEQEKAKRPFHYALAPELVWKGSKFERSLVTVMGQIGWEQIAKVIAEEYHGTAENGKEIEGKTYTGRLDKIHSILDKLEHSSSRKRKPDWNTELAEVLNVKDGNKTRIKIIWDLYIHNSRTDEFCYCEIKAPKPNSDQTKVSKEKMLKLKAIYPESNHHVYFALPFNPYKKRKNYNHPHPKRWFDMINDKVVLIGKEFWDLVGGNGTYEELIKLFEEVGQEYRPRINKEYFGL